MTFSACMLSSLTAEYWPIPGHCTGDTAKYSHNSPSRETRNPFIGPSEPRGCHTITFIELPAYTIEPLKQSVDAAQNEGRYVWALAAVFKASSIHSDNNVPSFQGARPMNTMGAML